MIKSTIDEIITKLCLDVKMDTKFYTNLIENSVSFERGYNTAKTTKQLDENTKKITGVNTR